MKIAIPRFGEDIAPCFEYTAMVSIFTVENGRVVRRLDFPLRSRDPLDRVRLLRDQEVGTVICGGLQNVYEDLLRASGIDVISWVTGTVTELLEAFLKGRLSPPAKGSEWAEFSPKKHPSQIGSPPDE